MEVRSRYGCFDLKNDERFWARLLALAQAAERQTTLVDALKADAPDTLTDPVQRWMLSAYVEFELGGPLAVVSALYWDGDKKFEGEDVILEESFGTLLPSLAQRLDMRLNETVTSNEQL